MIRSIRLSRMLLLLGISFKCGLCQVKVAVRLDQPEYLVGEPIFVLVDATNTGIEALGYSDCDGQVELSVPGGRRKTTPDLRGCFGGGFGGGSGCGIYHPPLMQPGQSVSFPYLLRGYRLEGGHYLLHASGDAGFAGSSARAGISHLFSGHKIGDVVEGRRFDVSIPLAVRAGTDNELLAPGPASMPCENHIVFAQKELDYFLQPGLTSLASTGARPRVARFPGHVEREA